MYTRGRPKSIFILGRKRKCRRKWNSIYGWKQKRKWHSFSAEKQKRKLPDNIGVSFFLIHSVTKSALQCTANTSSSFAFFAGTIVDGIPLSSCTVYRYLCGIFLDDVSTREQFVCFPGLLLPSESNFQQSMHCALLVSGWPNK